MKKQGTKIQSGRKKCDEKRKKKKQNERCITAVHEPISILSYLHLTRGESIISCREKKEPERCEKMC